MTGGGTGGHIYPALAIADACAREPAFAPCEVLYVGTRTGLEATIVPRAGMPIAYVHAAPLRRDLRGAIASVVENLRGIDQSLRILHRARPDVLVATGGYVAFPVVAALRLVRFLGRSQAKIALLEPNAVAGMTNRLLAPLVDETWYAQVPPGSLGARDAVVGMPVRVTMREPLDARTARLALGLDPEKRTVVVMGGSQGARSINEAVAALVEDGLEPDRQILVLAGARDVAKLERRIGTCAGVRILGYLDDPRGAYAAADIVVARAGASTLGELAATATPAILVPYPYATADHQLHNARAFARGGRATIVYDAELDAIHLRAALDAALEPEAQARMRDAACAAAQSDPVREIVARVKRLLDAKTEPS